MTFKEKLMKEHPEKINVRAIGGCEGCPRTYGYEIMRPYKCDAEDYTWCEECWYREIPETAKDDLKLNTESVADDINIKIIAGHYGIENQKKKLVEEMGELIQAVCKDDLPGIIEECADVRVMLDQVEYLMGIGKNVKWAMEQKVERQLERMNKAGEG